MEEFTQIHEAEKKENLHRNGISGKALFARLLAKCFSQKKMFTVQIGDHPKSANIVIRVNLNAI
jgi:hypothetical protein